MDKIDPTEPYPNQWDFLEGIQRIPETVLDEIVEINDLDGAPVPPPQQAEAKSDRAEHAFGLPSCARRMLAKGVAVPPAPTLAITVESCS